MLQNLTMDGFQYIWYWVKHDVRVSQQTGNIPFCFSLVQNEQVNLIRILFILSKSGKLLKNRVQSL